MKMDLNHFFNVCKLSVWRVKQFGAVLYLSIEAWLKSSMHFDCRYLELLNACVFRLAYIV